MSTPQNVYDAVEYPGFAYAHTHPDQLAVMALLYGLEPAPVASCRVLEIACNEGANLIPMAYAIPGSEFVGFDIAPECVARGQERIAELGLKNIRLFAADLIKVGRELGEFDYIIAHGLYAWVPEPVRDRLLALCGELLTPNGVAFVSYNALPGSHLRQMMREMMLFRTRGIADPDEKIRAGVEFIAALAETHPDGKFYRALFEEQLNRLRVKRPHVLFHDDFSSSYHPVYFSQFIEHAGTHGLQYLCEAELPNPNDPCFKPEFQHTVQAIPTDLIAQEQMFDFARMRSYRETLLCREHHQLKRKFPPASFDRFLFASPIASEPAENESARFYTIATGSKLHCVQASTIAVLEKLISAWPHALTFGELIAVLAEHGAVESEKVALLLLQLATAQMLELHLWTPPLAKEISNRPRAIATSRIDAKARDYTSTLWHAQVDLTDAIGRTCLQLLDGTRDRAALLEELKARFPETPVKELEEGIEPNLRFVYRAGLLEA